MSEESGDGICFLQNESNKIAFQVVEDYKKYDKTGTKLTSQFRFGVKYGNETFFATYWKPGQGEEIVAGDVHALVFITHGYAEYLGDTYDAVAKQWSIQLGGGSLVFGHDHVGHGRTTAGERAFVDEMDEFVDPIIAHIEAVQNWIACGGENLPVFLVGHSMGGLISIFTLFKKQNLFQVIKKYFPDNQGFCH